MSTQESSPAPGENTPVARPETERRQRRQPRYNVVLIDDDEHTYQYVVEMLGRLFGYSAERGEATATEVDKGKRAVLLTTTLEHAELKQEQVHAFGPDKRLEKSEGSMRVILEPVPEEG